MKLLAILLLAAAVVGTVVAGDESLAVSPDSDSPASSFVQLGDKAAPAAVETAPVDASMTDSTSAESESQAPDAENEDVDVDEDESARFAEEEDDDSEDTQDSEEDNDEDDDESDNNYDDDADDESTEEQEEENYEDGAAQALIQETEDEEDATEEDNNESVDEDAADVSDNEGQLESSDQDEQEEDIRSFLEVDEHDEDDNEEDDDDEDDNEEDDDDEDDDEDADDEEDALESEEDDAEDATDAQEQRFAEEGAADEETTERLAEEEGDDHGDENAVDEMRFAQLKKQEQTAQADPAAGPERAAENKNAPTNLQAKAKSTPPTDQSPPRSLALSGGAGPPPAGAINPFPFPPHKVVGQPAPLVTDLLKQNGINVLKPNVAANKNNPLSAVLGVTVLSNRNGNADAAACNCVGQANCACEPCPCALMVGPCACRAQISLSSVDPAKLTLIPKQSSTIVLDDCDNPPCSPEHEHQVFSSTHEEKVSFSSPESNRNQDFEQVTMLRPNAVNQLTGETMLRPAAVCTRQPC